MPNKNILRIKQPDQIAVDNALKGLPFANARLYRPLSIQVDLRIEDNEDNNTQIETICDQINKCLAKIGWCIRPKEYQILCARSMSSENGNIGWYQSTVYFYLLEITEER